MKRRFGAVALILATVAGVLTFSPREGNSQASSCLVTTTSGDVQGVDNGSSCAFLGIPFAAPPVGALRWRPPQPAANWAPATLNATARTAVLECQSAGKHDDGVAARTA